MNPKRTRALATAFMGVPPLQSAGSQLPRPQDSREDTPYHRGRGAGCANPKTTAKARGHYSKTARTSIGTSLDGRTARGVEGQLAGRRARHTLTDESPDLLKA